MLPIELFGVSSARARARTHTYARGVHIPIFPSFLLPVPSLLTYRFSQLSDSVDRVDCSASLMPKSDIMHKEAETRIPAVPLSHSSHHVAAVHARESGAGNILRTLRTVFVARDGIEKWLRSSGCKAVLPSVSSTWPEATGHSDVHLYGHLHREFVCCSVLELVVLFNAVTGCDLFLKMFWNVY
jgi:hypothetical protein